MKFFSFLAIFVISYFSFAQKERVLFIGNSYTFYNDIPNLFSQAASSAGDVVIINSNTPPNFAWYNHVSDVLTRAKIEQGNWDYVVLQEAGRRTGRSQEYIEENVFPYANELNNLIKENNPCGETMFYMTWGERNGVPSECPIWPPFCTYEEMDDLIRERYLLMSDEYDAVTSPVGAVWRYLRENHPGIDLYDQDGYHPSLSGSYAAAITFYTSIFKKDPNLVSFNSSLPPSEASIIREAVRFVVYDNLTQWFIGTYEPVSDFEITDNGNLEYAFTNTSENSNEFLWLFGDGASSIEENPTHTYTEEGIYEVTLNANYICSNSSISTQTISTELNIDDFIVENNIIIYPNPASNILNIVTSEQLANEYKIEIYSILGNKTIVNKVESEKFNKRINIESLKNGIYFLKIANSKNQFGILKFIKE